MPDPLDSVYKEVVLFNVNIQTSNSASVSIKQQNETNQYIKQAETFQTEL